MATANIRAVWEEKIENTTSGNFQRGPQDAKTWCATDREDRALCLIAPAKAAHLCRGCSGI